MLQEKAGGGRESYPFPPGTQRPPAGVGLDEEGGCLPNKPALYALVQSKSHGILIDSEGMP